MDLITSLIKHCRADATLSGIYGTRIDRDIIAGGTRPAMAIVPISESRRARHLTEWRVSFVSECETPVQCESTRQRLGEIFHEKWGATYSTGADAIRVESSMGAGGGEPAFQETADGPWQCQAFYLITITDVY